MRAPFPIPWDMERRRAGSVIPAAVLRDRRDGLVGDLPIEEKEIFARRYAEIETIADLRLVDLREDHAIRMGVPTDVAKSSRQTLARAWSLAFHEHQSAPDGITYPSCLNGHTNSRSLTAPSRNCRQYVLCRWLERRALPP
jgi:hypothetical protein